jgi:branched-chain amino acid transport system ATP-binding protein
MALLEARAIAKRFGGIAALGGVSLTIGEGEIYGLIGPNGAGKTTFFNCLTGLYRHDAGSFLLAGAVLDTTSPDRVVKRGIARTFQNIRLFAGLSVLENVMVGRHARSSVGALGAVLGTSAFQAEEAAVRARALELLSYVGLEARRDEPARSLPYGDQRRLEIARALATDPRLLALDEPAAGMNATETGVLRQLLERIRADGVTLLLIEHDVKLVMGLCDRVAVLDFGQLVAEGTPDVVRRNPAVIAAYLGASVEEAS